MSSNEKTSDPSRRRLLKSIAAGTAVAGTALPAAWRKPLVETVVLPAHAQTSGGVYSATGLVTSYNGPEGNSMLADVGGALLPNAEAQATLATFYACVVVGGSTADVVIAGYGPENDVTSGVELIRRGTLLLDGSEGTIVAQGSDISTCYGGTGSGSNGLVRPARIASVSDTEVVVQVLTRCGEEEGGCNPDYLTLRVPRRDSCLPEPTVSNSCVD